MVLRHTLPPAIGSVAIGLVTIMLATIVLVWGGSCRGVPGDGDIRVSGRLVDVETGRSVSRRSFYIHGFDDATGEQVTLDPSEGSEFAFNTTSPIVRLRIVDKEHKYKVYERSHTEWGDGIKLEAALRPTHFVRVHGRVLMGGSKDDLQPVPQSSVIGAMPFVSLDGRHLGYDSSGHYSIRLPREQLELRTTNFGGEVHPKELDLRHVTSNELQLDVTLKNRGYSDE